ncbi:MAG: tetratricopeptide repeat protein [candidate division Zixibacteria bacterium]|nr:tetratricopeptide repeat protein [candidate division Zixibacteria bacterium]
MKKSIIIFCLCLLLVSAASINAKDYSGYYTVENNKPTDRPGGDDDPWEDAKSKSPNPEESGTGDNSSSDNSTTFNLLGFIKQLFVPEPDEQLKDRAERDQDLGLKGLENSLSQYLESLQTSSVIPFKKIFDLIRDIYNCSRDSKMALSAYARLLDMLKSDDQVDQYNYVRVYDGLAKVHYYLGEYEKCGHYLRKAIKFDQKHEYTLSAQANLARVKIKLGDFQEAIELLEKVNSQRGKYSDPLNYARSQMSTALAYSLDGDIDRGLNIMQAVDPDAIIEYRLEQAIYHEYKGWIQMLSGKDPIPELTKGLKIAETDPPLNAAIVQIKRLLAEAYLNSNESALAYEHAKVAFSLAFQIDEKYELGILHHIMAQFWPGTNKEEMHLQSSKVLLSRISAGYEYDRLR